MTQLETVNFSMVNDAELVQYLTGYTANLYDLLQIRDFSCMTKAKAKRVQAIQHLVTRGSQYLKTMEERRKRWKITQATNIIDYCNIYIPIAYDSKESFYIILLDRANNVKSYHLISTGGVSGTVVDPKLVFQKALEDRASGMVLIHNHPSGNTRPSENDLKLTKKIVEASKLLEIVVLDHIILAGSDYYSFANEGTL